MIEYIEIRNFQAHKKLRIDFDEPITTIIGSTDSGKSAIIRALVWVITNKPGGDSFIRHGKNKCSVEIGLENGHAVQRIRGKKENTYILDGKVFNAIKTDVPEEMKKIFNISENCIQQQHDPIFWFSSSAGEVARKLNLIVNLDIIDFTLSQILSKQKTAKIEFDLLQQMVKEKEQLLVNCDKVELAIQMVNRVEDNRRRYAENKEKIEQLANQTNNLQNMESEIVILSRDNGEKQLITFYEDARKNTSSITNIGSIISQIKNVEKQMENHLEFDMGIFTKMEQLIVDFSSNKKGISKISELVENIQDFDLQVTKQEDKLKKEEQDFHKNLKNEICPLCGRGDNK